MGVLTKHVVLCICINLDVSMCICVPTVCYIMLYY